MQGKQARTGGRKRMLAAGATVLVGATILVGGMQLSPASADPPGEKRSCWNSQIYCKQQKAMNNAMRGKTPKSFHAVPTRKAPPPQVARTYRIAPPPLR